MGFSIAAAKRAVYHTLDDTGGGTGTEAAATWLIEHIDDPNLNTPFTLPAAPTAEPCKMVFVVNKSAAMGVGKIAAQVAQ